MKKNVLMLGTFDTKGGEFTFLQSELTRHGLNVISLNAGTMKSAVPFAVDIDPDTVATYGDRKSVV